MKTPKSKTKFETHFAELSLKEFKLKGVRIRTKDVLNLGDKSDMVRMESETCLNEVLTFVMLNRWIVKINIVLDF